MFADDHLILRLDRVKGAEKWQPSRAGLCFLFVRGGVGKCVIEPASQRLGPGDVLVLNSAAGGQVVAAGDSELSLSYFLASVEDMFPLFSVNEISLLHSVVENFKTMKFYAAGSPLAVECQRLAGNVPPQFKLDHRSHLLGLVAVILGEEFKTLQGQRHRTGFITMQDHLVQVFEKLSANDLLNLSAEELAEKFGCTRRHLSRLFHQHFGYSVSALRMEMRMLKAVSLLRESDAKIINVAERCGFNHLGLFNTCFKRRFGTSPGQWRTRMAQTVAPATNLAGDHSQCPFKSNGLCPMLDSTASNPAGSSKLQLKSVSLAAVFPKKQQATDSGRTGGTTPVRSNGHSETGGATSLHAAA